ncbi:hypothetical protein [Acrocarpospora catenulata]|uniref:hypothetical protein n=1 Tax=Acrocarpospora catenulata TaxID=2836182 RepID=UPI001BD91727|nr:hypothetical protein [Acrocarpospora catenulata]
MPAPESVRRAYQQVRPLFESVQLYVSQTLQSYCRSNDYLFFDRIKGLESLAEKIESGRYKAWSEIDDIYACSVVIPTVRHEVAVLEKLDSVFDRHAIRSRMTAKKAPDVFRFDTTRYYGRLKQEAASGRPAGVADIVFEIQLPTVFQYAWAKATHDLVYKGDAANWRKQRIAAQLKAAVETIELTLEAFDHIAAAVPESSWPEIEARAQIVAQFKELIEDGTVRQELEPISWTKLADNVFALVESYTGNRNARPAAIRKLLDEISAYLRDPRTPTCPTSGSLFQLIVGHVGKSKNVGSLSKYIVVRSEELETLYGLTDIPQEFSFDFPGAL